MTRTRWAGERKPRDSAAQTRRPWAGAVPVLCWPCLGLVLLWGLGPAVEQHSTPKRGPLRELSVWHRGHCKGLSRTPCTTLHRQSAPLSLAVLICHTGPLPGQAPGVQELTMALQEAISLTRSMTSWLKVVGQKTWETRPLLHASWAVSFRPQNSISLA